MPRLNALSNYFTELKRRNVFRVAAAYAVVGWLTIEVIDTLAPRMSMPEWVPGFVILMVIIGFPIALLFSWAFELTPEGIKKSADVEVDESTTTTTGQAINYLIIAGLAAVVLFQQFAPSLSKLSPFADAGDGAIQIAVLPFADLSAARDQEYLGDGVAEEILNVLAGIDGLKVTSRTSAFAFKGQSQSIPEIAKALGVTHVVEGSIRKQDNRVRITAQLINVSDDSHLWSDTYDANLTDIFRLQDEIAGQISSALSTNLNLQLPEIVRVTPNWNVGAYELYLKARQLIIARTNIEEALELLEAAIKLEPTFADAWAEKAAAMALVAYGLSLEDATVDASWALYDEAWLVVRHATELEPNHALATAVQGLIRMNQKRWIEARVYYERAIDVENPSDYAFLWLGILQAHTGDLTASLATFNEGLARSPSAPNLIRWRSSLFKAQGNWEGVWAQRETPSVFLMSDTLYDIQVAGMHIGKISPSDFDAWLEKNFGATAQALSNTIENYTKAASRAARSLFDENTDELSPPLLEFFFAQDGNGQAVMADIQDRLAPYLIKGSLARIIQGPNTNELLFSWNKHMAEHRQTPEFTGFMRALHLPAYWDLYGWPSACQPTGLTEFTCN